MESNTREKLLAIETALFHMEAPKEHFPPETLIRIAQAWAEHLLEEHPTYLLATDTFLRKTEEHVVTIQGDAPKIPLDLQGACARARGAFAQKWFQSPRRVFLGEMKQKGDHRTGSRIKALTAKALWDRLRTATVKKLPLKAPNTTSGLIGDALMPKGAEGPRLKRTLGEFLQIWWVVFRDLPVNRVQLQGLVEHLPNFQGTPNTEWFKGLAEFTTRAQAKYTIIRQKPHSKKLLFELRPRGVGARPEDLLRAWADTRGTKPTTFQQFQQEILRQPGLGGFPLSWTNRSGLGSALKVGAYRIGGFRYSKEIQGLDKTPNSRHKIYKIVSAPPDWLLPEKPVNKPTNKALEAPDKLREELTQTKACGNPRFLERLAQAWSDVGTEKMDLKTFKEKVLTHPSLKGHPERWLHSPALSRALKEAARRVDGFSYHTWKESYTDPDSRSKDKRKRRSVYQIVTTPFRNIEAPYGLRRSVGEPQKTPQYEQALFLSESGLSNEEVARALGIQYPKQRWTAEGVYNLFNPWSFQEVPEEMKALVFFLKAREKGLNLPTVAAALNMPKLPSYRGKPWTEEILQKILEEQSK